jgi:hypothetical protein
MSKFRSWNELDNRFYYFEDGRYNWTAIEEDENSFNMNSVYDRLDCSRFDWRNAQRFLFTNKFEQDVYVGSVLEGMILGSKVKVIVGEGNFGMARARCIECKSTDHSKSFNLNDVDILWCYNLKVVEDESEEEDTNG